MLFFMAAMTTRLKNRIKYKYNNNNNNRSDLEIRSCLETVLPSIWRRIRARSCSKAPASAPSENSPHVIMYLQKPLLSLTIHSLTHSLTDARMLAYPAPDSLHEYSVLEDVPETNGMNGIENAEEISRVDHRH
mmetsp:Transcript_10434/g.17073  ORF Transcript_10434/g.17073 Transcript_10434/m.17073 type:complete len:133 (+) Transcript_10434:1425-1823(+)